MASFRLPFVLAAATLVQGCIYANVTTPLSYRSPTPGDVGGVAHLGPEVTGRACNHGVLYLVGWGDAGYGRALEDARRQAPQAVLADVRADSNGFNVLGVYQRMCTTIRARVVQ